MVLYGQVGPFFDNKPIRDITPADVLQWQNEMIRSSRKETTINKILALTLSDIDFEQKTIRINKTLPREADTTTTPKTTNSIRTISIPNDVMADLKDYTNRIYDLTDINRLFFMEYQSIARYKNTICHEHNIRQIRIHDLRHSHVSLLINLDCGVMMITDRIGDTAATVQSTYAHLYPEKKDVILEKLENLVSK